MFNLARASSTNSNRILAAFTSDATEEKFAELDLKYEFGVKSGSYKTLFDALQYEESAHPEFLWRRARAERLYAINNVPVSHNTFRKEMLEHAFAISKMALKTGPENYNTHKWYAILLNDTSSLQGSKAQLLAAPEMKQHFEKSIELYPNDANTYHALGDWHFSFADIGWMNRKLANTLLAEVPESSYEQALALFVKAEETNPGWYSVNWYKLCLCYSKLFKQEFKKDRAKADRFLKEYDFWKNKLKDHMPRDEEEKRAYHDMINLAYSMGEKIENKFSDLFETQSATTRDDSM